MCDHRSRPTAPLRERSCGTLGNQSAWLLSHLPWLEGKHIVFIGSSITRYQYLNLAYHLLHGTAPPFDISQHGLELMDRMNVTRPPKGGDYEGYWASYYRASNLCLNANSRGGSEVCDCYRGWGHSSHSKRDQMARLRGESVMHNVDMRYTLSADGRTALTYAQWFMDEVSFRGHYHPSQGGHPGPTAPQGRAAPRMTGASRAFRRGVSTSE